MGVTGKDADEALERSAITCNKNGVPGDPLPPTKTSGIRVGSPAGTTRGFGIAEFQQIGDMIADVLDALREKGEAGDPKVEADVRLRVRALCERFHIYPEALYLRCPFCGHYDLQGKDSPTAQVGPAHSR